MNELQTKFLALVKKHEELAKQMKQSNVELAETMRQLPIGEMFQDPSDGVVYRTVYPTGTYVEYKNIGYERTRKEGEQKGSISMKEAEAAGFILGGKNQ